MPLTEQEVDEGAKALLRFVALDHHKQYTVAGACVIGMVGNALFVKFLNMVMDEADKRERDEQAK